MERSSPTVLPRGRSRVLLWDIVRSAFRSLGANRLRTALTMLGVMIGVGSVIAMIALGEGASAGVEKSIKSLGTNLLSIRPGAPNSAIRSGTVETLLLDDAAAITNLAGVAAVSPEANRAAQVKYFAANMNTGITGTIPEYFQVRAFQLSDGAFFTEADVRGRRRVAVLGSAVAQTLFPSIDPVGEKFQIKGLSFLVIGVLAEKGSAGWQNPDEQVVVPLSTHQKILFGIDYLSSISVQVADGYPTEELQGEIESILRSRHRIREDEDSDFTIRSQTELLAQMSAVTGTFTALLGGVAAVSLLVGGIGIMNIMLVSVRERTREIGIRKAVGARSRDILLQFLIEAVVVSTAGGIAGLCLGYGIAALISSLAGWQTIVPLYAVLLSVATSMAIGVIFGVMPAREAARLDPVEALRYE